MLLGGHTQATLLTVNTYYLLRWAAVTRMTRIHVKQQNHPSWRLSPLILTPPTQNKWTRLVCITTHDPDTRPSSPADTRHWAATISHSDLNFHMPRQFTMCMCGNLKLPHTNSETQLTLRDKTTTGRILRLARDKTCHLQSLNVFWHLTYEL